jgi:cytochrome c oxidase subunit III
MADVAETGAVLRDSADRSDSDTTSLVGMIAFLASWAMLFFGLFFAFGLARVRATSWPPGSVPALPLGLPSLNTGVIFLSSVALVWTLRSLRRGQRRAVVAGLLAASGLAALFLGLQFQLWTAMWEVGLFPSSGQYGSLFYALTWVHAVHVAIGLVALTWLCIRAVRGAYSPGQTTPVRLWALYWHFVGVAWLCMYVMIFWL